MLTCLRTIVLANGEIQGGWGINVVVDHCARCHAFSIFFHYIIRKIEYSGRWCSRSDLVGTGGGGGVVSSIFGISSLLAFPNSDGGAVKLLSQKGRITKMFVEPFGELKELTDVCSCKILGWDLLKEEPRY
jgi:hypothetical protein